MKIYNLIIILIVLLTTSCVKKDAYIFFNRDYYKVFENQLLIYNIVKKKLNRFFFNTHEQKINSFLALNIELQKLKQSKKESLLFLNDYLSSIIIKDPDLQDDNHLKLVTYNIPQDYLALTTKFPVYNITINSKLLSKEIISILRLKSNNHDLTDCGVLYNPDYSLSSAFIDELTYQKLSLDLLEARDNSPAIKEWLEKGNKKAVVLFGYKANECINDLDNYNCKGVYFIEVITGYGELSKSVSDRVYIDWAKAVGYGIDSGDFIDFIRIINKPEERKIFNYSVNYSNVICREKYNNKM